MIKLIILLVGVVFYNMIPEIIRGSIIAWRVDGNSVRDVADKVKRHYKYNVSKTAVSRITANDIGQRNRVKKSAFKNNTQNSGRKYKISNETLARVVKHIEHYRGQRRITARYLKKHFELPVASQTILNNLLDKHEISWMRRRQKTSPSKANKKHRIRYSKYAQKQPTATKKKVIYIDGATFYWPKSKVQATLQARGAVGGSVLRKASEGLEESCTGAGPYHKSQGGSSKWWGMLGTCQRGGGGRFFASVLPPKDLKKRKIKVTPKRRGAKPYYKTVKDANSVSMNESRFEDFVIKKMVPWCKQLGFSMKPNTKKSNRPIIVMDHEKCLRTARSKQMLRKNGFRIQKYYPTSSPDHNPIENCWSILKTAVHDPKKMPPYLPGRNEFCKRVSNEVRALNKKSKLLDEIGYLSINKRSEDTIELEGGKTRW